MNQSSPSVFVHLREVQITNLYATIYTTPYYFPGDLQATLCGTTLPQPQQSWITEQGGKFFLTFTSNKSLTARLILFLNNIT